MGTIDNVKTIELPKYLDARGNLSFAEQNNHIPFEIKRTYWIYEVPGGENRGGHAFWRNQEVVISGLCRRLQRSITILCSIRIRCA